MKCTKKHIHTSYILHLTSYFLHLTSYLLPLTSLLLDEKILRACGIEVAEVGIIVDAYV
jgi:hypothetical protein